MTARSIRTVVLVIVAFAAGLILAQALLPDRPVLPQTERATVLPSPRELPALSLVGEDGAPLGRDYFGDRWTLVFFGFATCPDICPTTLATLSSATKALADLPAGQQPRVLMVTVDPERDDVARLAAYVKFFDPAFHGATGEAAAIATAASAFGVPFAKVSLPEGGYTLDHGTGIFLVGPGGGIVAYFSAPHDAAVLARDYRKAVAYAGSRG